MPTACPGKDLAEIDFFLAQTDATATGDHDGFIVEGIVDVRQSGVGTWGRLVHLGRTFHVQSFVRAFVVEDLDELVKASLLLKKIGGGRFGGFFFQGQMHAFVTPVLLRMGGFDPFDADAQAQPPHGELAQVEQRVCGSEGHAVVAADVGGQAALLKKPLKHGKSVVFFGGRERLAGQQVSAGMIGDREWVAVVMIPEQELAFVIGTPELIGALA